MTHRSRLRHILVRWLVAYLRGRKAWCLYQHLNSPSLQVRSRGHRDLPFPTALFNNFAHDCPISELDMASYADDFKLLASALTIVEAKAKQLCSYLVRWADGKQLAITLLITYKAIVRHILTTPLPFWFTQVSSAQLDKHEVIQNKAMRVVTSCHQKAAASHLRAVT